MDMLAAPAEMMLLASAAMLLLLSTNHALQIVAAHDGADGKDDNDLDVTTPVDSVNQSFSDMDAITHAALHTFRMSSVSFLGDDSLGYWVKPRSTTWFSRFLLDQYDDDRWIKMFRMTKVAVFSLAELLRPKLFKEDTKYCLAIPVVVRVACTLFKLTHGAPLLICSEMFAVGRSTVSLMLRQVVHAINILLRGQISWPTGDRVFQIERDFRHLCGLPGVLGAIDGTHVSIAKPKYCPTDYYYYKSGAYSLNCQAIVDSNKRFLDLYLGMPGSINDSRVLRRSSLYHRGMQNRLWDAEVSFDGFCHFLLGDAGYPLLPWLMVPHRGQVQLALAETLFNSKMKKGRVVVENAFALLKHCFWELLVKSDLDVRFLPDVILACALLHNMLLSQSHEDVERFFQVLHMEGIVPTILQEESPPPPRDILQDDVRLAEAEGKRLQLGLFLAAQRHITL